MNRKTRSTFGASAIALLISLFGVHLGEKSQGPLTHLANLTDAQNLKAIAASSQASQNQLMVPHAKTTGLKTIDGDSKQFPLSSLLFHPVFFAISFVGAVYLFLCWRYLAGGNRNLSRIRSIDQSGVSDELDLELFDLEDLGIEDIDCQSVLSASSLEVSLNELSERVAVLEKCDSTTRIPVELLISGESYQWNGWRSQHPDQTVSLAGIDLTGKSLRNFDLSHVNFSDATLVAVDFNDANLVHADFSGANLTRSSFVWAKLSFADLWQANLQHANLDLADLSYARLDGANLSGCSMSSATLCGASLVDATLTSTNLAHSALSSANLTQIQADFVNFESADFAGAQLIRSNLSHSNFSWSKFVGADVSGANFTSALFDEWSVLMSNLKKEDAIASKHWHYDRTTNFSHTLLSKNSSH